MSVKRLHSVNQKAAAGHPGGGAHPLHPPPGSAPVTVRRIFFRQVFLAGIFLGGIVTSPPVISNGPSLSTDKISFSQSSSSQNLKLSIVSVRENSLVSRVDGIPDGRPIQVKNIYKCGFKNIRICVDRPFHDRRDFKIQRRVRNENVA